MWYNEQHMLRRQRRPSGLQRIALRHSQPWEQFSSWQNHCLLFKCKWPVQARFYPRVQSMDIGHNAEECRHHQNAVDPMVLCHGFRSCHIERTQTKSNLTMVSRKKNKTILKLFMV